jgi:hypothetical protein
MISDMLGDASELMFLRGYAKKTSLEETPGRENLGALTPLIYGRINPHGLFLLDLRIGPSSATLFNWNRLNPGFVDMSSTSWLAGDC